jgi:hypothetical protein
MNVYLISDGNGVKIGKADFVDFRMQDLQLGNSQPLKLLHKIYCGSNKAAFKLETVLHRYFAEALISNEWYKLTSDDVLFVKRTVSPLTTYNDLVIMGSAYKDSSSPDSQIIGSHLLPPIKCSDGMCDNVNTEAGKGWYSAVINTVGVKDPKLKELIVELANYKFKLKEQQ